MVQMSVDNTCTELDSFRAIITFSSHPLEMTRHEKVTLLCRKHALEPEERSDRLELLTR
jgi:hypothetical protein